MVGITYLIKKSYFAYGNGVMNVYTAFQHNLDMLATFNSFVTASIIKSIMGEKSYFCQNIFLTSLQFWYTKNKCLKFKFL